jgi:hypothetical protein
MTLMTDCKHFVTKKMKTPPQSSVEAWPRHLPNSEFVEAVKVGVARRRSGLSGMEMGIESDNPSLDVPDDDIECNGRNLGTS